MLSLFLASLIGLSLGLLGGGGSILTVPILVYAVGMDPKLSIALSLAIVGATSLVGVIGHFREKNIELKVALIFGPVAMVGTYVGAKLSVFFSGQVQLIIFSVIMLAAAIFMIKKKNYSTEKKELRIVPVVIEAFIVGNVTGLVGVGGGFLIVPSLVILTGIDMKKAVGTSLFIISLNSLTGFMGYLSIIEVPWMFLFKFILSATVGIFVGIRLVRHISQEKLRKIFAMFLLVMGFFILYKNRQVFLADIGQIKNQVVVAMHDQAHYYLPTPNTCTRI